MAGSVQHCMIAPISGSWIQCSLLKNNHDHIFCRSLVAHCSFWFKLWQTVCQNLFGGKMQNLKLYRVWWYANCVECFQFVQFGPYGRQCNTISLHSHGFILGQELYLTHYSLHMFVYKAFIFLTVWCTHIFIFLMIVTKQHPAQRNRSKNQQLKAQTTKQVSFANCQLFRELVGLLHCKAEKKSMGSVLLNLK